MFFRNVNSTTSGDVVIIGSHSHHVAAIDAKSGSCVWEVEVDERVESSACLSKCGRYVVVGSSIELSLSAAFCSVFPLSVV